MATVKELLGEAPSVDQLLGPKQEPEQPSTIVTVTHDDDLARAANDFEALRGTQFDPAMLHPGTATIGPQTLGQRLRLSGPVQALLGPPSVEGAPEPYAGSKVGVLPLLASTPLPLGPAEVLSQYPKAAAAAAHGLMAYFTVQFGKNQAEILPRLTQAVKAGDWQTVRELAGQDAFQGAMLFAGLRGHVAGEPKQKPAEVAAQMVEEGIGEAHPALESGVEPEAVAGAQPTVQNLLGSPTAGQDLRNELLQSRRSLERQSAQQEQAANLARKGDRTEPAVPESAPEPQRDEPVLAEIRRTEARTIRQIQELFPQRELTRAQAREFRNAAWGEAEAPAPEEPPPGPANVKTPVVGGTPASAKAQLIAQRIEAGIDPNHLRVTVNPIPGAPGGGYVQVDLVHPQDGNVFSSNPEQMTELGLALPASAELLKSVPAGQYTPAQLEAARTRPTAREPARGAAFVATTPLEGAAVSGNWDVVESDKLLTSFDAGYDPQLQPRDRTRAAAVNQVANIMRRFEPERVGNSPTSDLGAPLVDENNQVLSGNGRTAGIRGLYGTGRDQGYREWLLENAQGFGLDPEAIAKMARPVLVRRVSDYGPLGSGNAAKVEFARQSNQQQVLGMSAGEKAASDARLLAGDPELLALFRPGDDGNVLAAGNREFLNRFIEGTGDQAELLTKDGYNGPTLAKRVKHALLSALLGPEQQGLASTLIEGADELNLKTASNEVLSAAPRLIRFKGTPYDLSGYLGQALQDLVRLRQSGLKLEDMLGQSDMFSERSGYSDLMLRALATERSAAKLGESLARYGQLAKEALKGAPTADMFGVQPATREQLVERVYGKSEAKPPAQTDLPTGKPPAQRQAGSQPPGPGDAGVVSEFRSPEAEPQPGAEPAAKPEAAAQALGIEGQTPQTTAGRAVPGRQQPGALQGRLSGGARAQAQASRAQRAQQPGQAAGSPLAKAAANLAARSAAPNRPVLYGLRKFVAPQTLDEQAREMAGIARAAWGSEYEHWRQADFALQEFRTEFDRTPVARTWQYDPSQPLPRNYEVMRAIDSGDVKNLTPLEARFALDMRRLLDEAIDQVHAVSPNNLRNLLENYFPRIWDAPEANLDKINQLMARRPWEGPKSFLRKRVLQYFTDGLDLGLRPVSDNPVDVTLQKLGEMYRFVATRRLFEEAKASGLRRFIYTYEEKPVGWRKVADPSSDVWAPPTVTIKEAYDEQARVKTLDMLAELGVPHQRLASIGGRGRWGLADPASGKIVTKFAGPTDVIWHEMGHQIDFRYPDLAQRLGAHSPNSVIGKQLAALADLRFAGKQVSQGYKDYVRQKVEKMANVFQAYLGTPDLFRKTAPAVWDEFGKWLEEHPEIKVPLNQIKPSLVLGSAQTELDLAGPVKLGDWYMPDGAAQVVENHLTPGLGKFATFRGLRQVQGILNSLQLIGGFHAQLVNNDVLYSAFALPLYDAMKGRPLRGLETLVKSPVAPVANYLRGRRVERAIAAPGLAQAVDRQIADLAMEANLRSGHSLYEPEHARRWARAVREMLATPSSGAAGEVLWRAPLALLEKAMAPVFNYIVPRMKYGMFAQMASRVIEDNPNASQAELRRLLGLAADATEDRLGQVTYDNLFQARVLKDMSQGALRAYGWHFTKYRMAAGGLADWVKYGGALMRGQTPEVTFRMTYLPAMVMGHMLVAALVSYAFTRKLPQSLSDYFFPNTGAVDAYGQPVRLSLADIIKDFISDWRRFPHPIEMAGEWAKHLAPFWNMAAELARDRDFYGEEIWSRREVGQPELQHAWQNIRETAAYVARTDRPFSLSAGDRLAQTSLNPALAKVLPWLGYVPAPRYVTQSRAEALAADLTRERSGPLTHQQAAQRRAVSELVRDLRTGKVNGDGEFVQRARAAGMRDQAAITRLRQRVLWSPLQYQVNKLQVGQAMQVFDLATEQERISLAPFLAEKIHRAAEGKTLSADQVKLYVRLIGPYFHKAQQGTGQAAPQSNNQPRARYSAFTP